MWRVPVSIVAVEHKVANIMNRCTISFLIRHANIIFSASYLIAICGLSRSQNKFVKLVHLVGFITKKFYYVIYIQRAEAIVHEMYNILPHLI